MSLLPVTYMGKHGVAAAPGTTIYTTSKGASLPAAVLAAFSSQHDVPPQQKQASLHQLSWISSSMTS
eukprot:CAMPEP_0201096006 /NCGR_PEP_ID=MMETSP0812-20130820/4934_1 /ASSEMBLY_ACC=CAM_ASM_000668 /TAXON_ID=98059 /ORGANISM="Dinobryon sp., Strain UTEXLB2267" /LENGTH=66 /DNA_ID=CAMNT_0047349971 /DNA_START=33 /DNA_END=231 /DNA_ORIENTATION=-